MNKIQSEICKLLHYILNSDFYRENYYKPGLKIILGEAVRQFPEINYDHRKTWKKINLYLINHKISTRAAKIIDINRDNPELWKLLHYEHIIPVKKTILDLLELGRNPILEDIQNIMSKSEVIILSKEESNILDGSPNKLYPLEGKLVNEKGLRSIGTKKERLNSINITIDKRYINNTVSNKSLDT